ncbi:CatB-related O-acetyltransferase [Cellulomonas sp. Leaf334]|uniref:CatB-related O-acetyltransferase n=1 Tax=Cellulomonas sp. Leaf334 TaxID=1736339 RepID=UPI00138EEFE2|nr:CatB-related O-acetyltransferase [Cellulomonas sp. Leaf334]
MKYTPRRVIGAATRRLGRFARLRRAGRVSVGYGSYGAPHVVTFDNDATTRLRIGRYCSIASTATILLGGGHPTDRVSMYPVRLRIGKRSGSNDGFPLSRGDIEIQDGVWIGHEALILSGVTIGSGAVIGARAVVARDVPPYAIVAGNPARLLRYRFDDETIAAVESLGWPAFSKERMLAEVEVVNGPASRLVRCPPERASDFESESGPAD